MHPLIEKLERRRSAIGLSRSDLAKQAGVHRVSLERITSPTNPSDPRLGSITMLAAALDYTVTAVPRREILLDRAFGAAVAEAVADAPEPNLAEARRRLSRFGHGSNQKYYTTLWQAIIEAGAEKVIEVHLDPSTDADPLRATSPFVPNLSSETRRAIRSAVEMLTE